MTKWSLLVFFGILIYASAAGVRSVEQLWTEEYGQRVSWVRNAMTRDAFCNIRRFLHFVDNTKLPKGKSDHRWSPLQKVQSVIDHFSEKFAQGWRLGKNLCIDESMIKYTGRAISWVQYMPAKPIKHGIKVFSLCCADSAYLASFEIYTGARAGVDGTAVGVVGRLLYGLVDPGTGAGRVMYTDNFYTGMALAVFLWAHHSMFLVGTHRLSKKLSRTAADFPFHKLSNPALHSVPRGWLRWAVRKVDLASVTAMWCQCIVWKDKKQVAFFSNYALCNRTAEDTCERRTRGAGSDTIPCHPTVKKYAANYNGVDRADRDVSDWGLDLGPSARWYMRIVFWLVSMAIHNCFCIVVDGGQVKWEKYTKGGGRIKFQMDLAHALARRGIAGAMAEDQAGRPSWMRQTEWLPCACKHCHHCRAGITTGVAHRQTFPGGGSRSAPSSQPFVARAHEGSQLVKVRRGVCDVCMAREKEFDRTLRPSKKRKAVGLRKDCHWTQNACASCNLVRVCGSCEGSYQHDLVKQSNGGCYALAGTH